MAAKRGKSQARRNNNGNSAGLPGWAWLVLGVVLTIGVVLVAPKYLKGGDGDGFIRPRPNPDAQPATSTADDGDDAIVADDDPGKSDGKPGAGTDAVPKPTQYDFYTLLPGEEVAMSDAELAATAREEAARKASAAPAPAARPDTSAQTAVPAVTTNTTNPAPASATAKVVAGNDTPYILQAGAFGASGDAEAVKARIALLGLGARVESASIDGKTVFRVRMGPYGTASELAEAKRKLANGGLPALAIKVK